MAVTIYLVPDASLPSNQPADADIARTAAALTEWINTDLGPDYGEDWQGHYTVEALPRGHAVPTPNERIWLCHLLSKIPVFGALGYHDRDNLGNPVMYIDMVGTAMAQLPWSLVVSHEVAETIVNPHIDQGILATYGAGQGFYYKEACDPVERQPAYLYNYKGQLYDIANYVLPSYWVEGHPGPKYDRLGYIHAPLHPAPGGQQAVYPVTTSVDVASMVATGQRVFQHPGVTL